MIPSIKDEQPLTLPLPTIETQPSLLSPKRNLTSFRKKEHIPLPCLHFLSSLIRNLKIPINNDFAFIVCVFVDELWAGVETVETGGDGGVGGEVFAVGRKSVS